MISRFRRTVASQVVVSLGVFGVLIAGCRGAAPSFEGVLRLLDTEVPIEVEWPETLPEIPDSIEELEVTTITAPARAGRVSGSGGGSRRDVRASLVAPTPSVYRIRVRLPSRPSVLQTGLGGQPTSLSEGARIQFRIRLTPEKGSSSLLLDETVGMDELQTWLDRSIPLNDWAGKTVTIELEVLRPQGGPVVFAAWSSPEIVARQRDIPLSLLVVSLDTLRADRLGCYGYSRRPTSPQLDALASKSILFEQAFSQSSWTRPSHRSLFTGLYPRSRRGLTGQPLAETLWQAGFRTLAITGGVQLHPRLGFARGFDSYRVGRWLEAPEQVASWLERSRDRQSFVFLHTYEIHEPYKRHGFTAGLSPGRLGGAFGRKDRKALDGELTADEKTYVEALYDSGIRHADQRLGELLALLRQRELLDSTLIVVLGDHGEQFWEHGAWGHGQTMYDHQIRVPLLLHIPERVAKGLSLSLLAGRRIPEQVQLIDLYPTLLELLRVPLEHEVQGRSLVPVLRGDRLEGRDVFAEGTRTPAVDAEILRTPRYKLVHLIPKGGKESAERFLLFDLASDPGEMEDVAALYPEILGWLRERLEVITSGRAPEEAELDLENEDPELLRQLEALGYVDN